MRHLIFLSLIVCIFINTPAIFSDNLSIENEFIKIVVNNSDSKGRFSLETTLGNPDQPFDNFQDLIYGKPIPWTSYTTFLIDDTPYIFGNEGKKLKRRSSFNFNYLPLTENYVSSNKIISKTKLTHFEIEQHLTYYKNPNTNLKDSILISYKITNSDSKAHSIGTRILLDTKLGTNDGAPLRLGNKAITNEIKLDKSKLYQYWQAFDSLVSPNIIAQGLLSDINKALTIPDYIHLANWGSLVDKPWNATYKKGRSFIRVGEKQKDTALALEFLPKSIEPGKTYTINTVYGLGGLSFSEGELSLGLSAPKELPIRYKDSFLIVGYLFNSSKFDSYNTVASFKIPDELQVIQGSKRIELDILKSKEQKQIPLLVKLISPKKNNTSIELEVTSKTFDSNIITRNINFIGPSKLIINSKSFYKFNNDTPYFVINTNIKNPSNFQVKSISATLSDPTNIVISKIDSSKKFIHTIPAFGSINLQWAINASTISKNKTLTLNITSKEALFSSKTITLSPIITKKPVLSIYKQFKERSTSYMAIKLKINPSDYIMPLKLKLNSNKINFFHYFDSISANTITFDKKALEITIDSKSNEMQETIFYFKTKSNIDSVFELLSDEIKLDQLIIKPNN
jgi:hypothetical protein